MRIYISGSADTCQNYSRAVTLVGGTPCFDGTPDTCGALLLPGGGDVEPWRYGQKNTASRQLELERDARELALLEQFLARGKPVLGICRGMQVINVFFGGDLIQDLPGHSAAGGADRLHPVRTAPSFLRELCGAACTVNSAHHQAVGKLGTGLDAVQWAQDGTVEALCHKTLPVWGVQWHPERLSPTGGSTVSGLSVYRAFLALAQQTQEFLTK